MTNCAFNVGYCYADDVLNFWDAYKQDNLNNDYDPDCKSKKLQNDLQFLYNRDYLSGLIVGKDDYDYLFF